MAMQISHYHRTKISKNGDLQQVEVGHRKDPENVDRKKTVMRVIGSRSVSRSCAYVGGNTTEVWHLRVYEISEK